MLAYVFPGQGSQKKGMGRELFDKYPELVATADIILGYSIQELCLEDRHNLLSETKYTQTAIFIVSVLSYLETLKNNYRIPDFVAGHSLGEYSALFAGGVFDFESGLKIVKKRGELMSQMKNGSMAAVIGLNEDKIRNILKKNKLDTIDIANLNTPTQIVVSGPKDELLNAKTFFEDAGCSTVIPLEVSGAFHSRLMEKAKEQFTVFLEQFIFSETKIPVISNVLARPYLPGNTKKLLADQITHSVKWNESIRYLMGKNVDEFVEIGPGAVLTGLVNKIKNEAEPLFLNDDEKTLITAVSLGNSNYKKDYNLKYAYASGGMAHGIASKEIVVKMGKAGMIGYFGTGALKISEIRESIKYIKKELKHEQAYGMNLISGPKENDIVNLFLQYGVRNIEAAAYLQITPALVKYRLKGLKYDSKGRILINNKIMAKLSRPEIAEIFLRPAPKQIITELVEKGEITNEEFELSKKIPMADDICVEADSGGHTDQGSAYTLMPAIIKLRDKIVKKYHYSKEIRIGAAGGIGTPEAAAAAFILGADFILTGSINQCTVEAGTSDVVKDLLQEMNVQDTMYAPAGDMFEIGSKVQVLKKSLFFPARANKLYDLYRQYDSLDDIDEKTKKLLEKRYFKRPFEEIYEDIKVYYSTNEIERAERSPKQKMALIFKWYFGYATRLALNGQKEHKVDFQIMCGPALGAFNQWVKNTNLENWKNRHVDNIAELIMSETAELLNNRFQKLTQ